jgi:hypothetical protein
MAKAWNALTVLRDRMPADREYLEPAMANMLSHFQPFASPAVESFTVDTAQAEARAVDEAMKRCGKSLEHRAVIRYLSEPIGRCASAEELLKHVRELHHEPSLQTRDSWDKSLNRLTHKLESGPLVLYRDSLGYRLKLSTD